MDLPHSDGCFVRAYPAETAEAFCDGHVAAFDFFGGVPRSILYDNTRPAVARIVKGGERLRSHMFAEVQSHYLFDDRFGRPGKGNDKGKVEGLVGYVRRNFMTPLPVADSFDALNARFLHVCTTRGEAILRGHTNSIAERMRADVTAFMQLPPAPYDACHKVATRVSSLSLVRLYAPEIKSLNEVAGLTGCGGVKFRRREALCVERRGLGDEARGTVWAGPLRGPD